MQFLIITGFRNQNAAATYKRVREEGRLIPDGMVFKTSYCTADLARTFQIFECEDITLIQRWCARWSDLCDFEVLPVVSGAEAAAALLLDAPASTAA